MTNKEAIDCIKNIICHGSESKGCLFYADPTGVCTECEYGVALKALERYGADGCEGCQYEHKDEFEMPCLLCKRNNEDFWRAVK